MGTIPTKKPALIPEQRPTAALQLYLETILYKTRERLELINITRDLNEVVRKHGLKAGAGPTTRPYSAALRNHSFAFAASFGTPAPLE